jgi:uncharacterized protein YecE (DUF72 family)
MIRIGPAGWSYKDWQGIVYPSPKPRGFHEIAFLAQYFDSIEINTSFYGPISAKTSASWLKHIEANPRFRFTAKLWRGFTHGRDASASDRQTFLDGIAPLLESGKFGVLLFQFPWSFRNTVENRDYVARLREQFSECAVVLEVRHSTWSDPGTLDMLAELDIGLCNIDQPLFQKSIAPAAIATSAVGYIRLHGRNYQSWFTENKHSWERYDYLYSIGELEPWLDRIKAVNQAAKDTYVVTNNHYLGKGVVNALEIRSILYGDAIPVPDTLLAKYPELEPFSKKTASGQMSLE